MNDTSLYVRHLWYYSPHASHQALWLKEYAHVHFTSYTSHRSNLYEISIGVMQFELQSYDVLTGDQRQQEADMLVHTRLL
jgi:hypothetical protein